MSASIVFLDTETTGLSLDDDIWEFAAIRLDDDLTEKRLHLFIEHDEEKCKRLPESFREDHYRRFPSHGQETSRVEAARKIEQFFGYDKPHVVGCVPNFDTERLARLLGRPLWHYHLIDVETLAVGWLVASGLDDDLTLPWKSDEISRRCGVEPPSEVDRHTAMGDAEWAMRWFEALSNGGES